MTLDKNKLVKTLSGMKPQVETTGLIDNYGVLINQTPATLWVDFASKLTHSVGPKLFPAARTLLVNAARECAYHTGHGFMSSPQWRDCVNPLIEDRPADILHALFAFSTALGIADWEIVQLSAPDKLQLRANSYYESECVAYGKTRYPSAYTLQGVACAFMDLVYGGPYDPQTGPRAFDCEQVKGIEMGDAFAEFIVTRCPVTQNN